MAFGRLKLSPQELTDIACVKRAEKEALKQEAVMGKPLEKKTGANRCSKLSNGIF
jgi:hypothetical protein